MQSQTHRNGEKTKTKTRRHTRLDVANKNPNYDYSFRLRKDIEESGGVDPLTGFEVVKKGNEDGESVGGPLAQFHKTKSGGQFVNMDTILCRRPKEISAHVKQEEDERYNSQLGIVRNASTQAKHKLRTMLDESGTDGDMQIKDSSTFEGRSMTQRKGKTE